LPLWLLLPASRLIQKVAGNRNPVHPVRVRKAATPTHIVPQTLIDLGFDFKYDFARSLVHWQQTAPEDFGVPAVVAATEAGSGSKVVLTRGSEDIVEEKRSERELVAD